VDTGLALLLREAGEEILAGLKDLLAVIRERAEEHRVTLTIGRTHGIHAEPITFGLKCALWYAELQRGEKRLKTAMEEISVGKLSGAVGNFAHLSPAVEKRVCELLGLTPEAVATQVVSRDRHAAYLSALALIAAAIEKIALEIRHLQRTEVREVQEPFSEGQKGSSAMPHKRNPVLCENLAGLSRYVRSQLPAAFENILLWHERDISHSSVERMIFPDVTTTVDFMVHRMHFVLKNLRVFPERMRENLESLKGIVFSQKVLLALTDRGMNRNEAYELVQQAAFELWDGTEKLHFRDLLKKYPKVSRLLKEDEIDKIFDYEPFLKHIGEIYERVFKN